MEQNFFLNVARSVTGYAWVDALDGFTKNNALAISQKYGFPDQLSCVLAARNVDESEAERFIDPKLRDLLPDPLLLTDMGKAAERIEVAIINREKVAIFGDYDVDGACSTAILARFLRFFGIVHRIYIPDRITEGYGPNALAMEALATEGYSLIITVDCGANSAEAIQAARHAGSDVVVLDHHQMDTVHSAANALVNPNRPDDLSDQGHLCAAGVVFLTLVQICRQLRNQVERLPDLLSYLDLVALATICDVVPLKGVNRAFVRKGLQVARMMNNCGLSKLVDAAKIGEPLNSFHLGYLLGPRINAGGRIGDQALGARLLTIDNEVEAQVIAEKLDRLNLERKDIELKHIAEAEANLISELEGGALPAVIVVSGADWHPGIVGLLSARIKERYQRPTIALAVKSDGRAIGSGRSIEGYDLGSAVRRAVEIQLAIKGGGHAMAAGITIANENIELFKRWMCEQASSQISTLDQRKTLKIDGVLSADSASEELYTLLEKAGPYGNGNPNPVFVVMNHRIIDIREIGKGHLALSLGNITGRRLKAIAFRAIGSPLGDFLLENRGSSVHVAGNLSINHWNGTASPQFRIIDAAITN